MFEFPSPDGVGNRIKLSRWGYLRAFLIVLIILTCIVLYVSQFDHFGKMLDHGYFLILSTVLGLGLGVMIGHQFAKEEHDVVEKMRLYVFCAGLTIVFMPLFVGLANRYLDFKVPQSATAQLLELKSTVGQPYGYVKDEQITTTRFKIVFLFQEEIFDIITEQPAFLNYQPGANIPLTIRSGLFGIRYFDF